MYFSILPNLEYDVKPKSFPFSSADFTIVKNFYRRFEINADIFSHVAYYNKYSIPENVRIDQVAMVLYGRHEYDWIIALMNNITNIHDQWPLNSSDLQLYSSTDIGALFIDGLGDGLYIVAENCGSLNETNSTSFGILQASRTRITKTEYISCPSCGRTLFDLQDTTAMIRSKTDHLKGIKIGLLRYFNAAGYDVKNRIFYLKNMYYF